MINSGNLQIYAYTFNTLFWKLVAKNNLYIIRIILNVCSVRTPYCRLKNLHIISKPVWINGEQLYMFLYLQNELICRLSRNWLAITVDTDKISQQLTIHRQCNCTLTQILPDLSGGIQNSVSSSNIFKI